MFQRLFFGEPTKPDDDVKKKEEFFQVPKGKKFMLYCSRYPPYVQNPRLPNELWDIKKTPDEEKKKIPPEWPENPCFIKNHEFNRFVDLSKSPGMNEEQVHELLLRENYVYHKKITDLRDDFVKNVIKETDFEWVSTAYNYLQFLPVVYPEMVDVKNMQKLDKRGFFSLAKFHGDFLKLALEQVLMDEAVRKDFDQNRYLDLYQNHNRLVCIITMSMARMKLKRNYYNYSKAIRKFQYRDPTCRIVTNLRTMITLRMCYLFSILVWRVLYIYRFDAKPPAKH